MIDGGRAAKNPPTSTSTVVRADEKEAKDEQEPAGSDSGLDTAGDGVGSSAEENDAEAYNPGLFYAMPSGTELRLTYSELQNKDNAGYDFGINAATDGGGEDVELRVIKASSIGSTDPPKL